MNSVHYFENDTQVIRLVINIGCVIAAYVHPTISVSGKLNVVPSPSWHVREVVIYIASYWKNLL